MDQSAVLIHFWGRTIKHMLFMRITKHAEKLNKCTQSKLRDKETVVQGLPSYDQGLTWAVDVGSHLKDCPIMIENINMNGQMLIEVGTHQTYEVTPQLKRESEMRSRPKRENFNQAFASDRKSCLLLLILGIT